MNTDNSLTDEQLQTAFENCTLPHEDWNHRAHVRMAFLYASRNSLEAATSLMRQSIKAYNAAVQTPESLDRGYHETMTVAFMRLIHDAVRRHGPILNSDSFCESHPALLDRSILRKFYSRERIMTAEAKRGFVEPDLSELPE